MNDTWGCVHIHYKDGHCVEIVPHIENPPENGVVHLSVEEVMTRQKFEETHPQDTNEGEEDE